MKENEVLSYFSFLHSCRGYTIMTRSVQSTLGDIFKPIKYINTYIYTKSTSPGEPIQPFLSVRVSVISGVRLLQWKLFSQFKC